MVQWLRLRASNAGGACSIPGWGTKIPRAVRQGQKKPKNKIGNWVSNPGGKDRGDAQSTVGPEEGSDPSVWKGLGVRKGCMEESAFKIRPSEDHH